MVLQAASAFRQADWTPCPDPVHGRMLSCAQLHDVTMLASHVLHVHGQYESLTFSSMLHGRCHVQMPHLRIPRQVAVASLEAAGAIEVSFLVVLGLVRCVAWHAHWGSSCQVAVLATQVQPCVSHM